MVITLDATRTKLILGTETHPVTCHVRNELNGERPLHDATQVIHSIPSDKPYMPRVFPAGDWTIGPPRIKSYEKNPLYWPFYIPTDAWQLVDVWELDPNGGYLRKSGQQVRDTGYGLHFCKDSITTWGCVRLSSEADARWLAEFIQQIQQKNEVVTLHVADYLPA